MKSANVLVSICLALLVLVTCAVVVIAGYFKDPVPDRFVVGVAPSGAGAVIYGGDCMGGRLQSFRVAADDQDGRGSDAADTVLWELEADGDGLALVPDEVFEIGVGDTPQGMVEKVPFEGDLPMDETIQVSVDTDRQGYSFFFELADLDDSKIFAGGHGHVTSEEFDAIAADLC